MTGVQAVKRCVGAGAAALLLLVMGACDDFGFYEQLDGTPSVGGELAVDPISATVHAEAQIQFLASGGVLPYVFRVLEGSGAIDAENGRFTAPAAVGSSLVEVRDAAGTAVLAQVITVE